eukprot:13653801-Ditylum_brightwellii.AAC.1
MGQGLICMTFQGWYAHGRNLRWFGNVRTISGSIGAADIGAVVFVTLGGASGSCIGPVGAADCGAV